MKKIPFLIILISLMSCLSTPVAEYSPYIYSGNNSFYPAVLNLDFQEGNAKLLGININDDSYIFELEFVDGALRRKVEMMISNNNGQPEYTFANGQYYDSSYNAWMENSAFLFTKPENFRTDFDLQIKKIMENGSLYEQSKSALFQDADIITNVFNDMNDIKFDAFAKNEIINATFPIEATARTIKINSNNEYSEYEYHVDAYISTGTYNNSSITINYYTNDVAVSSLNNLDKLTINGKIVEFTRKGAVSYGYSLTITN